MANLTKTVIMRMAPDDIAQLDSLASNRRRATGEPVTRVQIIREAIRLLAAVEAEEPGRPPKRR